MGLSTSVVCSALALALVTGPLEADGASQILLANEGFCPQPAKGQSGSSSLGPMSVLGERTSLGAAEVFDVVSAVTLDPSLSS